MSTTTEKFTTCGRAIESLSDFLACVAGEKQSFKSDLLFRGQRCDWTLLPKLARYQWRGKVQDLPNSERIIMDEFRRVTARLVSSTVINDWDLLAVAQHHGLPTRLIDWTYSALAALWMVVKQGPDENGENRHGVVWILKAPVEDFIDAVAGNRPEKPSDVKESWVFRPKVIADRIHAQSGIFTVHALSEDTKQFIPLEVSSTFTEKLFKILIPASKFESLRQELHECGVNDATMFPDLDGICKHLTWRYADHKLPAKVLPNPEAQTFRP
jgi:hypothetical protein